MGNRDWGLETGGMVIYGMYRRTPPADWYLAAFPSLTTFTARILHRMRESAKVGP